MNTALPKPVATSGETMTATRALMIFDLDGARFAVDATQVRETIWLPELTPLEETPPWVVGVFSLRGCIVPVADLHLRFGHPARRYRLDDKVVVLAAGEQLLGLIVSEVIEVVDLPGAAIQPPPQFNAATDGLAHLVAGEARVGEYLVSLLDIALLASQSGLPAGPGSEDLSTPDRHFCPEATPQEQAMFHARALALCNDVEAEAGTRLGLAVVELGGEYFGIALAAVREFCDIVQASPIPCCPLHILGVMSLRGELVTLIDPRSALDLPPAGKASAKAVVARLGEQAVGIAVDEVRDAVYLRDEELQPPPPALRERHGAEIIGTAPYGERTLIVLNLPALLAREEWIVDETV